MTDAYAVTTEPSKVRSWRITCSISGYLANPTGSILSGFEQKSITKYWAYFKPTRSQVRADLSSVRGAEPFVPGTESFVHGAEPFVRGPEPFVPGAQPFVGGSQPFVRGSDTI
jgi:hypothetical protein